MGWHLVQPDLRLPMQWLHAPSLCETVKHSSHLCLRPQMFSRHVTGESRRENDEDGMAGEEQHTEEEVIHAQHTAHGHVTGLDHTHW